MLKEVESVEFKELYGNGAVLVDFFIPIERRWYHDNHFYHVSWY